MFSHHKIYVPSVHSGFDWQSSACATPGSKSQPFISVGAGVICRFKLVLARALLLPMLPTQAFAKHKSLFRHHHIDVQCETTSRGVAKRFRPSISRFRSQQVSGSEPLTKLALLLVVSRPLQHLLPTATYAGRKTDALNTQKL